MLSVSEACNVIKEATISISYNINDKSVISCPIHEACGETLASDIFATIDNPTLNRSLMDGFVLRFEDWAQGTRSYNVLGICKTGELPTDFAKITNDTTSHCHGSNGNGNGKIFEITTGACPPDGFDCVVPIEDVVINNDHRDSIRSGDGDGDGDDNTNGNIGNNYVITLSKNLILQQWQYIQMSGSDFKSGTHLLYKGQILNSSHIGILASLGYSNVPIFQKPKIAIITTGDELVDIDQVPKSHQIRRSNAYVLKASLFDYGYKNVDLFHFPDNKQTITDGFKLLEDKYSFYILTGGVSKGRFDFIPEILKNLEMEIVFHRIKQRPGKPLLFARKNNSLIFALPGNPISALVSLYRYILPTLMIYHNANLNINLGNDNISYNRHNNLQNIWQNTRNFHLRATLSEEIASDGKMTYYNPISVQIIDSCFLAKILPWKTSGDLGAWNNSDGFIELQEGQKHFSKQDTVPLYTWR